MNKVVAIFLGILFSASVSFGQKKDGIEYSGFFDTYYYRGPVNYYIGGGLSTFKGDVFKLFNNSNSYYGTIGATYQVWPRTYFGADLSYINLKGSTSAYTFENTGINLDIYGRFLLIDKTVTRHGQLKDKPYRFRPYILAGVGYFSSLNSSTTYYYSFIPGTVSSTKVDKGVLQVPVGGGIQIWVSHRFSIMPEFIYRFAFSDQLDGLKLSTDKSGMDGFATLGLKLQITPNGTRLHKKKTSLAPPEQYNGPKGTDYPRKREETKPKKYGQPLPGEGEPLPGENQENMEGGEQQQGAEGEQQQGGENKLEEKPQDQNQENSGW